MQSGRRISACAHAAVELSDAATLLMSEGFCDQIPQSLEAAKMSQAFDRSDVPHHIG